MPHASHNLVVSPLPAPRPGRSTVTLLLTVAIVGVAGAALHACIIQDGWRRFMLAYVVAFSFVLSLSLGALFFVIIQHLTRAGWSVVVRRPAEVLAANGGLVALLFIPIALSVLLGGGEIYPWARPDSAAVVEHGVPQPLLLEDGTLAPPDAPDTRAHADPRHLPPGYGHQQLDTFTLKKRAYLNTPFFLARWVLMLGLWAGMGWYFWRLSLRQDVDGDPALTRRMERAAAPAALLFGLSITWGAFDLLMSLNPHWYSTIFGVYYFSGAVVGGLAVLILAVVIPKHYRMPAAPAAGEEHLLDLGRLLFAFVFFWGYIAFSQYLLLWYANMPDTTSWLHIRGATTAQGQANAWSWVLLVLLTGHFVIPFIGLMSRHAKRYPVVLGAWAVWLLVMHYLDLLWLVMPELGPELALGAIEVGLLLALSCVFVLGAVYRAGGRSVLPHRDPRVHQSIAREPAY